MPFYLFKSVSGRLLQLISRYRVSMDC